MPSSPPNVLLICTDHWSGELLGCEGHPSIQTPTLDQLAANGTRFRQCYSECPVCVPARRTLMSGLTPHGHGLLSNEKSEFPSVTTMPQAFRDAGYQAYGVGKLHVFPQRQKLGFDDILLDEEGRAKEGAGADDYELFLGDHGFPGQRFAGGMNNNQYLWRPWHLDESLHVTNWAAQQMCRTIRRRDPLKPAFWYLSFSHPHPPLAPLQAYLEIYRELEPEQAVVGDWTGAAAPPTIRNLIGRHTKFTEAQIRAIRKAFYALCTHIDHQLRVVIGTLREERLLDNTIIMFTSDHGDMLGDHGMWAKQLMYERSARIPLLVSDIKGSTRLREGAAEDRPVGLADVMPTLLELAGVPIPRHVEGRSAVSSSPREAAYSAFGRVGMNNACRMVRYGQYKLIYYPEGNVKQLFDLVRDPHEEVDLSNNADHRRELDRGEDLLIASFSEEEHQWLRNGRLVGVPAPEVATDPVSRSYSGQRGSHWPPPIPDAGGW